MKKSIKCLLILWFSLLIINISCQSYRALKTVKTIKIIDQSGSLENTLQSSKYFKRYPPESYKVAMIGELVNELSYKNILHRADSTDFILILSSLKFDEYTQPDTIHDSVSYSNGKVFEVAICSMRAEIILYNKGYKKVDQITLTESEMESADRTKRLRDIRIGDVSINSDKGRYDHELKELPPDIFNKLSQKIAKKLSQKLFKKIRKEPDYSSGIDWKSLNTDSEVKYAMMNYYQIKEMHFQKIMNILARLDLPHTRVEKIIYAKKVVPFFMYDKTWLMEFYLDGNDNLEKLVVRQSVTSL